MKQGVVSYTSTGIFQEYSTEILFKFPETGSRAGIFRRKLQRVSCYLKKPENCVWKQQMRRHGRYQVKIPDI